MYFRDYFDAIIYLLEVLYTTQYRPIDRRAHLCPLFVDSANRVFDHQIYHKNTPSMFIDLKEDRFIYNIWTKTLSITAFIEIFAFYFCSSAWNPSDTNVRIY